MTNHKEDKNGHKFNQKGELIHDERCRNCSVPKEAKCPHAPNLRGHFCSLCVKDFMDKEERKIICPGCGKCTESMPNGELCEKLRECECHYASSPTWETQEREAWYQFNEDEENQTMEKALAYWIARLKGVREEAYNQGKKEGIDWAHVQDSTQIPFFKEQGRSQALDEVREMLKDVEHDISRISQVQNWQDGVEAMMHQIGRHMQGGYNAEYEALGMVKAYSRILSSLQQLKDKK